MANKCGLSKSERGRESDDCGIMLDHLILGSCWSHLQKPSPKPLTNRGRVSGRLTAGIRKSPNIIWFLLTVLYTLGSLYKMGALRSHVVFNSMTCRSNDLDDYHVAVGIRWYFIICYPSLSSASVSAAAASPTDLHRHRSTRLSLRTRQSMGRQAMGRRWNFRKPWLRRKYLGGESWGNPGCSLLDL